MLFTSKLELHLRKTASEMLHSEHNFVEYWNWDILKNQSEIPWQFWKLVLEKAEEDQLTNCVKNDEVLYGVKEEQNILRTLQWEKNTWISHILPRDCLLKHIIKGTIEAMRRWNKKLLDALKEKRDAGVWKRHSDHRLWGTYFRRSYGPVARQIT